MSTDWIAIKERRPPSDRVIRVKADYGDEYFEGKVVFRVYDIDEDNEAWGWTIKEGYNTILRPTHWMELDNELNSTHKLSDTTNRR